MRLTVLTLGLLAFAVDAHAIVDVHDEYFANPDESRFSVFAFDFSGASGNKDENNFELENHSIYRGNTATWMFVGSMNFAETNNVESENNAFAHLRYVRPINAGPHGFELFTQYSQDQFELLDQRIVFGGGYRFKWKPGSDTERGLLGAGVIREHERYVDIGREQRLWRGNFYVTVSNPVNFARDASISFSTYAQPALKDVSDIRAIGVMTVKAMLSERLGVRFSLDFRYDSEPEDTIESTNVSYSTGITYTLK